LLVVPTPVAKAFENKSAIEGAQGRLRKRLSDANAELPLGHGTIRNYLGQGNADRSHRGERQIREAISALKQSGRYDEIVDEVLRKHPLPVAEAKPSSDFGFCTAEPFARLQTDFARNRLLPPWW
jgi:hypothetical protein